MYDFQKPFAVYLKAGKIETAWRPRLPKYLSPADKPLEQLDSMVISIPVHKHASGPRPVNLNKDIPQLMQLLQLVFGEKMEGDERRIFTSVENSSAPGFVWRFNPAMAKFSPGFVWEENGRIVGNVTLLPTKSSQRYLVANVGVHPDFRRRGIGRLLMESVEAEVRHRGGHEILLQVVKQNAAAIDLYNALGYRTLGSMTLWESSNSRLREIPVESAYAPPPIFPLEGKRWREAYRLETTCLHPDLNWPESLPENVYQYGFWRRMSDFLGGRQVETWAVENEADQLIALGQIESEWGRAHRMRVRVLPAYREQVVRPLLAKMVRLLRNMPRRKIRIEHPDDDVQLNNLLFELNFTNRRTLTHMRRDL